jgi:membrane-anchored mycosin MYCP
MGGRERVAAAALTAATSAGLLLAAPGASAAADGRCGSPPQSSPSIVDPSWTQDAYAAPDRLWGFSRGQGVVVAVLDTGVDATHPQLAGKVLSGADLVSDFPGGTVDCTPHGTALAGVVNGSRLSGIGSYGLAPDAVVLPVRVAAQPETVPSDTPVAPALLAQAIDTAVSSGAAVVDVGVVVYGGSPELAAAVDRALAAGVVVVAAAGDAHDPDRDGAGPTDASLTPYPAAYPGVIGVGAVGPDGVRVETSQIGAQVDLVAPGTGVIAPALGGHAVYEGTSIASAFVAATVALVLADPAAALPAGGPERVGAVTDRLLAAASPPAGAAPGPGYGAGLLDPYRTLTEEPARTEPVALPGQTPPPADPVADARAAERSAADVTAVRIALATAVVAAVVVLGAVLLPRGRRRRWRAGRVPPAPTVQDDGPEFLPGEALFSPSRPPR